MWCWLGLAILAVFSSGCGDPFATGPTRSAAPKPGVPSTRSDRRQAGASQEAKDPRAARAAAPQAPEPKPQLQPGWKAPRRGQWQGTMELAS